LASVNLKQKVTSHGQKVKGRERIGVKREETRRALSPGGGLTMSSRKEVGGTRIGEKPGLISEKVEEGGRAPPTGEERDIFPLL